MSSRISRRNVLRAASGALLALPLLPSLRSSARAQAVTPPKRFVTMYTPNGVIHEGWWPTAGSSDTDFQLSLSHEPLKTYQDRLLILSGIEMKVASAADGAGGPHQRGIGGLFTNTQLGQGAFVDGCGRTAGWATGISIDQRIAAAIGAGSPVASLQLGVRATENDVQGRISYAAAGMPLPPLATPLDVYKSVFQDFLPPAVAPGEDAARALLTQRRSVLDAVASEFGALQTRLSAQDRQTLDAHLTLIRDVERRLSIGIGDCQKPPEPAVLDPVSEVDMPTIAELQLDLLAVAFACDLTRVASFEISTALNRIRYPWVNSLGEGHALSHSGAGDPDSKAQLLARQNWHSTLIARLFDRLALIAEGDGSVLDNTLLFWGNEVSLGTTHSHDNMPFVVAGGKWAFRTGRYVQYTGNPTHGDLLVSLLNAMGVSDKTFGDARFCTGSPLPGLV
ncbi:MAG TPA: DUF1552 domain-containing protein [Polyangiaceae bacterium]|nr:DUF1552 domain-containing protein [Polyangiaceae bacterium]